MYAQSINTVTNNKQKGMNRCIGLVTYMNLQGIKSLMKENGIFTIKQMKEVFNKTFMYMNIDYNNKTESLSKQYDLNEHTHVHNWKVASLFQLKLSLSQSNLSWLMEF